MCTTEVTPITSFGEISVSQSSGMKDAVVKCPMWLPGITGTGIYDPNNPFQLFKLVGIHDYVGALSDFHTEGEVLFGSRAKISRGQRQLSPSCAWPGLTSAAAAHQGPGAQAALLGAGSHNSGECVPHSPVLAGKDCIAAAPSPHHERAWHRQVVFSLFPPALVQTFCRKPSPYTHFHKCACLLQTKDLSRQNLIVLSFTKEVTLRQGSLLSDLACQNKAANRAKKASSLHSTMLLVARNELSSLEEHKGIDVSILWLYCLLISMLFCI